jgi:hypothetical protein
MSSSNRGSSAARMSVEEETNVDEVVNLASEGEDSEDDQNYFDSLRHSKRSKRNQIQHSSKKNYNRFNDNANVAVPFNLKMNDKSDPLAKLYDTAVLKIPKVIPSDNESLYSECNSSFSKSRFGETDLYGRRRKPAKAEKLEEAEEEEDLYEVIRSEEEESGSSSESGSSDSSICDVYVNKYMTSGLTSEMSATEGDDSEKEEEVETHPARKCDISSMGKMIVTIGGGSDNKEASVSSGKLLIEVRDERVRPQDKKVSPRKVKQKWRENRDDDEDNFDPDTLERGLGDKRQIDSLERVKISNINSKCHSDSSVSVINHREGDLPNPDYSFRLFNNGQSVDASGKPQLPPKTRGPSSIYSSTSVSICSDISSKDVSTNDKPKVPPKSKQKNGLTAERKQYFEGLSHNER